MLEERAITTEAGGEDGRMGLKATSDEIEWVGEAFPSYPSAWTELVPLSPLGAGYEETSHTKFLSQDPEQVFTHIRVNMGPDGGIARLRVHGEVVQSLPANSNSVMDLAAVEAGGLALAASNSHFGTPRNLLAPGRGDCMVSILYATFPCIDIASIFKCM